MLLNVMGTVYARRERDGTEMHLPAEFCNTRAAEGLDESANTHARIQINLLRGRDTQRANIIMHVFIDPPRALLLVIPLESFNSSA
jgi:hypothetical protein